VTNSPSSVAADVPPDRGAEYHVLQYVGVLALATLATVVLGIVWDLDPPGENPWWVLPFLAAALVVAEHLRVRFRRGSDIDAITLFEAVLAPLLFTFPPQVVVPTVAVSQAVACAMRHTSLVKAAFNIAMWSLAAGVGGVAIGLLVRAPGVSLESLTFLVIALACVAVVNNTAFTFVLAISGRQSLLSVLRGLAPIIVPGWVGGWLVNTLFGLIFVLAAAGHPIAVVLFPVPLALMHLAYRGYASARADRLRLTGLRSAANALSEPLHPLDAIDDYLREVVRSFEAGAAALILVTESGEHETFLMEPGETLTGGARPATDLDLALAASEEPVRIAAAGEHPVAGELAEAGWRDCLCAPLVDEHRRLGALVVYDQTGLEGTATADLAVLEALARETAHTLARGRLLESVMEERRKLDQIMSTTSDGIFTLGGDGAVLSWNAACEQITGLHESEVLGRRDTMQRLRARTTGGAPTDFGRWAADPALPHDVVITARNGMERRLSCSTSAAFDDGQAGTLVVVARDITPSEEYEELREQFSRLAEAEAAQRLVVDHLQQAVAPEPPEIDGLDLAVTYVASDPSSPTGGDLYDWHLLPSGELHVAVVDVLGHGVSATKAALTVVHTLRLVAVEGTPLDQVVARADALLDAQDSDLVATVIVARYNAVTGDLRVASGGHPPALVVGATGDVTQLAATGGAIGWPAVGSDNVVSVRLGLHESLVLYTDGLIEARKDILEGMDSLVRHASEVAYLPADRLADQLVERALSGADRRDDSLALVLRRTPARVHKDRVRWHTHPGDPEGIKAARQGLLEWLDTGGFDADDPLLVASELLANAVVAARESVVVTAQMIDDTVVLEVADDGHGDEQFDSRGRTLPETDSEHGRGLFLVRSLSQSVSIMSTAEGTVVRCAVAARPLGSGSSRLRPGRLVGPGR